MGTADKNNDGFFKELFRKNGLEKAPRGFADRVMSAIEVEENTVRDGRWSWSGWWLWGSIIFALACLVGVMFFVDFSFMGSIFNGIVIDEALISRVTSEIGKELLGMPEGFSISPLTVTIVVAIIALIVADRLMRRRAKAQTNLI